MRRLSKPVLCGVHGRAFAGGCGLATACDLVLAHEDSSFGYPEVKRGFVPAMVLAMLLRSVGEKIAFDLVGTGRILTATEAHGAGLVSRVLAAESFEGGVRDTAATLASGSASALALTKKQFYELEGRTFEDAVALGARVNAIARSTPDFRKAIAQFFER